MQRTDGSPPVRLGQGRPRSISRNGREALVFDCQQSGRLWLLPIGSGTSRSMDFPGLDFAAGGYWAAFLPDMKRAGIAGRRSEGLFGLLVDLETGKTRPVTPPLKCCNAQLSPDGRFLAAEPLGGGWTSYPLEDGLPASLPGVKDGETVIGWTPGGLLVSPDAERRWGFPRADSTVH